LWYIRGLFKVYIVSNKGIEIDKAKVEVIEKLPALTFLMVLKSFPRFRFYWWFIKDFSKIAKPLT